MNNSFADLKLFERDAFRRFYEDGILDIFFGLTMVVLGIAAMASEATVERFGEPVALSVTAALGLGIAVPLLVYRRHLLRTRLGEFTPGADRRRRLRLTHLALLASATLGVVAFGTATLAYRDGTSTEAFDALFPLVWFLNAVVVLGAMAYFLDVPRFYLYGFLYGATMPLLVWPDMLWDLRLEPWLAFGGPGVPIVVIGFDKLRRFLIEYPVLTEVGPDE